MRVREWWLHEQDLQRRGLPGLQVRERYDVHDHDEQHLERDG